MLIDNEIEFSESDYYYDTKMLSLRKDSNNHVISGYKKKVIGYRKLDEKSDDLLLPLLPEFEIKDPLLSYINKLENGNFEDWKKDSVSTYKLALSKIKSFYEKCLNDDLISLSKLNQTPINFIPKVVMYEKCSYKDNYYQECFTFKGLREGDILVSKKSVNGLGGDLIAFPMELIKKGKGYKVDRISSFGFYTVPWCLDEDACSFIPNYDDFELLNVGGLRIEDNVILGKYVY